MNKNNISLIGQPNCDNIPVEKAIDSIKLLV